MADLKVTILENIVLKGDDYRTVNTKTFTGVDNIFKRVVTCPASQETTVAVFNSNVYSAAGAIDVEGTYYIRVTNVSITSIKLGVATGATNYTVSIGAGESHILSSPDDALLAETDASPNFGSGADIVNLIVNPGTTASDVEVFIATA